LIEEGCHFGLPALTLTDRDGVCGIVPAHVKAREIGVKLIVGSQVTLEDQSTIILLAQDRHGYATGNRRRCRLHDVGR
jgi:error-prone DNA polymerase